MRLETLARSLMMTALAAATVQASAQTGEQRVEITGSSIKRIASEGALPVQVITREQLVNQGISTAEQAVASLSINGNGLDNLASNSDVVAGAARGNNGATCANLRGQGCAATLILLNGRRVAAHGLNGGTVDLNTIPFAAIERIEILKDGASAIYGTDAIGGVMNFILRSNYRGVEAQAFVDLPQKRGGEIYRASLTGGFGDIESDRYNLLVALSVTDNKVLRGDQRDFVNTFQPNRGLSVDTRGTPFATAFAISTLYSALSRDNVNNTGRSTGPTLPGGGAQTYNGINVLDLPGQVGCSVIDGMQAYDEVLWATPSAKYGCAWDTGRAAVLQQPVKDTNVVVQGNVRFGEHQLHGEVVAGRSESAKTFSANQISSSTSSTSPLFNLGYPSTGSSYNFVFNELVRVFPQLEANRGRPIAFRWRCLPCGSRQIDTTSDTSRLLVSLDGPIAAGWDYKLGISSATSDSTSVLGDGYFYGTEFAKLINTGVLNPFLLPGQSQTQEALDGLKAVSANGVTLYGGKYTLTQSDATVRGPLFKIGSEEVMAAVGVDVRKEKFRFNGNATDLATQSRIFNAPFDSINTLDTVKRDIKAIYAEVLIPVTKRAEVTVAGRRDDYTGFGSTTNPKVSLRFTPIEQLLTRASYSKGFRVPTFNQLFFGVTESTYAGKDLVDPGKCAGGVVDPAKAGCESITPVILSGGKPDLGPERSKQWTAGFVFAPNNSVSVGADWWSIRKLGTIQALSLSDLVSNYNLFQGNFIRDASGALTAIDARWVNAGESITRGVDINAQASANVGPGRASVILDGSYLLEKKSRLITSAPFGASEVGVFTRAGDLGLRWKYSLTGTYAMGDWTFTGVTRYRSGYLDAVLPGVANGSVVPPDWHPRVSSYQLFDASVKYKGIKNLGLTFGIKNLFDKDPPFSAAYDSNTGAGSSWEPRVADPRGRSFTITVDYKFLLTHRELAEVLLRAVRAQDFGATADSFEAGRAVRHFPSIDLAVAVFPAPRAPVWANVLFSREMGDGYVAAIDAHGGPVTNVLFHADQRDAQGTSIAWLPQSDWSHMSWKTLFGQGSQRFIAPYPASLLKVMVAVGVGMGVDAGLLEWPAEAVRAMLTVSDNDATTQMVALLHRHGLVEPLHDRLVSCGLPTLQLRGTRADGGWGNGAGSGVGMIQMTAWDSARLMWLLDPDAPPAPWLPHGPKLLQGPTRQRIFDELAAQQLNEILSSQRLRGAPGWVAGIPDDARFAHKTGTTENYASDAGIVRAEAPGRRHYVIAALTNLGSRYRACDTCATTWRLPALGAAIDAALVRAFGA